MLARGGMGEIYLARTVGITGFEKYYAVKKLLKKFTSDNDVGARFVDEAKLGARLQHPNIVQVYDLGRVSDELYMATEFVDGFDLRRVLRFCHEKKKRIPLDIALFIVREVLSGLAYAHRQVDADGQLINLIHRDISPQNVLVSFEGEVKIIDFGLAKSTQRSQETQANVLLGNFGYMSPEQARGQILDVRTDVYSCGIVLFELVTGTKRFVEENPLRLLEMVARPTPILPSDRVPSVPKAIDKIYEKAVAQDRDDRYVTAEAFRDDITAALHKLNPKASRENLAQFLNHLFLGGQAPPSVDNDVLNKSVVLMARDLNAGAEAFTGNAVDDLKNRSLSSDFADSAPQTASLPLLRSARVGDELSHDAITGEATGIEIVEDYDDLPVEDAGVRLDEAFDQVGLTAQIHNDVGTAERPPSSQDGAILSEEADENQKATRVYDSPSWPQGEPVEESIGEATEIRTNMGPSSSELDVQRQLDEQAEAAEAQAEIQRQLEAQLRRETEVRPQQAVQHQLQQQMEQAAIAEAQRIETQRQEAQRQAAAVAQRQAQLDEQARQAAIQKQLDQQARQQALQAQLLEAQAAPEPSRNSRRIQPLSSGTSTETAMPAVDIAPPRRPPPTETPSIMLAPDLEADVIATDEATIRNPRAGGVGAPGAASGGFGAGGAHESLIIDFGSGEELSSDDQDAEMIPIVEGQEAAIRPAARPLGRPVVPSVTSAKPRRVSDEGPPSTMPPPTRRR
jgi:serine/threonine protein kinase